MTSNYTRPLQNMLLVILAVLVLVSGVAAQESDVIVPDLTGMNAPQAAAALNKVGLRLGKQTDENWSAGQPVPEGGISAQSVAAGATVEAGSVVDVTVLRSANIRLLYDDNDLTIINLTDSTLDLSEMRLVAVDGGGAAFDAARLGADLRGSQCLQMWAVSRSGPKTLEECSFIQNWLSTTNTAEHFWTTTGGTTGFAVRQNRAERAACVAAPPNSQDNPTTCEFYLPAGGQGGDVAEYVYLVYDATRFLLINNAPDEWMRTNQTTIHNANPNRGTLGASFVVGDPAIFGSPDIVAQINRLAPSQCLLYTSAEASTEALPETCEVIAQLDLPADQLFWSFDFELEGREGERFTCPAAVEGKRVICAMPR